MSGTDIPLNCHLGGGLLLPHPTGVVIHSGARIGPNAVVLSDVPAHAIAVGVPARLSCTDSVMEPDK